MKLLLLALTIVTATLLNGCGGSSTNNLPQPDAAQRQDQTLKMNQIQGLGTHNSYHIQPPNFGHPRSKKTSTRLGF